MKYIIGVIVLIISVQQAVAGNFFLYAQVNGGGDTLAYGVDSDGSRSDYYEVNAGGGFEFGFGGQLQISQTYDAHIRITYGYNEDKLETESGDTSFKSTPVEFSLLKSIAEQHLLGVGLIYESSPEWSFSRSSDIEFDTATGYALQYGYQWGNGIEMGAKYRLIDYEIQSQSVSGDGLSAYFTIHFN